MASPITDSIRTQMSTDGMQQQSASDLHAELYKMHPSNAQPPLPRSPMLRLKATGEIFPWCEQFASRPDLVDCCDSDGNVITIPEGMSTPAAVYNTDLSRPNVGDDRTPTVGLASEVLGVDAEHSIDYTEKTNIKDAFPLPKQEQSVAVSDLIAAVIKDNL